MTYVDWADPLPECSSAVVAADFHMEAGFDRAHPENL